MKIVFATIMLLALPALAFAGEQQPSKPPPPAEKRNPCAEFGAGFVQVEGSSTCVKLGGSIDIGGGGRSR